MSDDPRSDIEKLIRLKRYETPGEEYFQSFSENFKDRQRSELLCQSSVRLLGERVDQWMRELGPGKWLVPAGAAAALTGAFFLLPRAEGPGQGEPPLAATSVETDVETSAAALADTASPSPRASAEKAEVIQFDLPRSDEDGKVPAASGTEPPSSPSSLPYPGGLVPAGASGPLREL